MDESSFAENLRIARMILCHSAIHNEKPSFKVIMILFMHILLISRFIVFSYYRHNLIALYIAVQCLHRILLLSFCLLFSLSLGFSVSWPLCLLFSLSLGLSVSFSLSFLVSLSLVLSASWFLCLFVSLSHQVQVCTWQSCQESQVFQWSIAVGTPADVLQFRIM